MSLVTRVLMAPITNLTDARYGAGMGVEFLAFNVNPSSPHYIQPERYQEMIGWIAGPRRVADISGFASIDFQALEPTYRPEYLLFHIADQFLSPLPPLPCMVRFELSNPAHVSACSQLPASTTLIAQSYQPSLTSHELLHLRQLQTQHDILWEAPFDLTQLSQQLNEYPISGIVLSGSEESRPGLKDLGSLADILELLEEQA
ncbi:MAG: hypothetical protein K1X47_16610 [Cyclobacteriaceae bacterium]|nr:hypothetical protein [Cyclobacteriaceae bacterium]